MTQKRIWRIVALLIAFAVIGAGCFFLGRSLALSSWRAERELNIRISVLIELKKVYGCSYDDFFEGLDDH